MHADRRRLYFTRGSRHHATTVYFFNAARRQHTAIVSDVPWVVDSDWIIASVLCFPYYRVSDGEAPVEKMAPRRKCKFNDDWRSHFTWIAKLPDNGMAQCNLCVTDFSISSGGHTDVRRHQESAHHAKLVLRRRVGWSSVLRFAILAKVGLMLAFVIIPISNAASERAFSMVRKIETDFRLLLSEEVGYECEYKLIQLFSDKHVQR